jgi:YggT family protein
MINPFQDALSFLINTIFDLFLMVLAVRFILCWVRADYFNPITRFIVQYTQSFIGPLRRIIPTFANIEFSTLLLIFALNILRFYLLVLLTIGTPRSISGLLILSGANTLKLFLNTFFFAILFQALLSFVQQGYSPLYRFLDQLTLPVMRPIRRLIPPMGVIDLSPIPALILLQLLLILIANPLLVIGMNMTF